MRFIEISTDALTTMATANVCVEPVLVMYIKNCLCTEHAQQQVDACGLKHQHLSTSETALLDAFGRYRPESMCLTDRQEASISIANISIECVSCSSNMQIVMPKGVPLSHTAMEVEMAQRNQDATVRTYEFGQNARFPH